jgi:hypothetical protein
MNGVPRHYILQMQHYLAVTGLKWGTFAIFNADRWELMLIEVERDEKVISAIIKVEEKFWNEHVVPRKQPEQEEMARIVLPKVEGVIKNKDTDKAFANAIAAYRAVQQARAEADDLVDIAKEHLLEVIHHEPGVYENMDYRVYYTPVSGRTSFDKKALAGVRPLDPLKVLATVGALTGDGNQELGNQIILALTQCDLDLKQFEKKGDDFMTLRYYPAKRED